MSKLLFRLSLLLMLTLLLTVGWFLGRYQIIRTDDGYHVIRNETWGFSTQIVDTRNWKLKDYWENPKISGEMAKNQFKNLRNQLKNRWNDLSEEIDSYSQKHNLDETSAQVREKMAWLREETKTRYQDLLAQMEKGNINMDSFKEKLGELSSWTQAQIQKFKEETAP